MYLNWAFPGVPLACMGLNPILVAHWLREREREREGVGGMLEDHLDTPERAQSFSSGLR